jgi:hypothetical protein
MRICSMPILMTSRSGLSAPVSNLDDYRQSETHI